MRPRFSLFWTTDRTPFLFASIVSKILFYSVVVHCLDENWVPQTMSRGRTTLYLHTTLEKLRHQKPWTRRGAVLDHCDWRGLQAEQHGHIILRVIGRHVPRHGEQGWVSVAVYENGDGLLHTHKSPYVTSLPQCRILVQDKATNELTGCPQRVKLHVFTKLGGGECATWTLVIGIVAAGSWNFGSAKFCSVPFIKPDDWKYV